MTRVPRLTGRRVATLAVAACALAAAPALAADATQTFIDAIDAPGSAPGAPDILSVAVGHTEATATLRMSATMNMPLVPGDLLMFTIDVDGDAATGEPTTGEEVVLFVNSADGSGSRLFGWDGTDFRLRDPQPPGFSATGSGPVVTWQAREADLGIAPGATIGLSVALGRPGTEGLLDRAPELVQPDYRFTIPPPGVAQVPAAGPAGSPWTWRRARADLARLKAQRKAVVRQVRTRCVAQGLSRP